jgi:D-amino-acid dehydrogenase
MKNNQHVIVIGAGIVGLSCAFYLRQKGYRVSVVEKRFPGAGASTGNAGLIVPSHFIPLAAPGVIAKGMKWMFDPESPFFIKPRLSSDLADWLWKFYRACTHEHVKNSTNLLLQLHLASKRLFQKLAATKGFDFDYTEQGLLMLCNTEEGWGELQEMVEDARELGLTPKMLTAPEIHDMDESIDTCSKGGAYFPDDAHLTPGKLIEQLSGWLQENGVVIYRHHEVSNLLTQNNTVTAVMVGDKMLEGDHFVLASGAETPALAGRLGLKLPIQAAKGYSITYQPAGKMPHTPLILEEAKVAVTPMGKLLRLAGTLEISGEDLSVNQRRVEAILKAVPQYLPELDVAAAKNVQPWAGLRPCSPDGLPYLGKSRNFENLVIAAGHAMIGISLGPITGKVVADMIHNEPIEWDMGLFSPDRYA